MILANASPAPLAAANILLLIAASSVISAELAHAEIDAQPPPCREESAPPQRISPAPTITGGPYAGPQLLLAVTYGTWCEGFQPYFLLYKDRTVVFRGNSDTSLETTTLGEEAFAALVERLRAGGEIGGWAPAYHRGRMSSHPPVVRVAQWLTDPPTQIELVGFELHGESGIASTTFWDSRKPPVESCVPETVEPWLREISTFSALGATTWVPRHLEIRFQGYEYAPDDPPLDWPDEWPGVDHRWTRKVKDSRDEELVLIYMNGSQRAEVDAFLEQRGEKQAIGLGGRKVSAYVRPIYPALPRWEERTD